MQTKYSEYTIKPGDKIKIRTRGGDRVWVTVECHANSPSTGKTCLNCRGDYDSYYNCVDFDRVILHARELADKS